MRMVQHRAHHLTLQTANYVDINLNPLNTELIPICYLLALLGAHHFLHVSRIRVKHVRVYPLRLIFRWAG